MLGKLLATTYTNCSRSDEIGFRSILAQKERSAHLKRVKKNWKPFSIATDEPMDFDDDNDHDDGPRDRSRLWGLDEDSLMLKRRLWTPEDDLPLPKKRRRTRYPDDPPPRRPMAWPGLGTTAAAAATSALLSEAERRRKGKGLKRSEDVLPAKRKGKAHSRPRKSRVGQQKVGTGTRPNPKY